MEVLIVNDGSTDATLEIAEKYKEKYPDIFKIMSKENGGHGSVINEAAKIATGKYFKVIDADDWIENENLTAYIDALEKINAEVVLTHYKTFDIQTKKIEYRKTFLKDYNRMYCLKDVEADWGSMGRCLCFHGITYNTSFYRAKGIKLVENVFYEDNQYATIPCCYATKIYALDLCLYVYRIGDQEQSVSEKNRYLRREHEKTVIFELCRYMRSHELKKEELFYFEKKLSAVFMSYFVVVLSIGSNRKVGRLEAREMKRILKRESNSIYSKVRIKYLIILFMNYLHITYGKYKQMVNSHLYKTIRRNKELQTEEKQQKLMPVFGRESINLAMAANNGYVPYLAVLIHSIIANSKEENDYDIVILHRSIAKRNRNKIKAMAQAKLNISIRFFDVSDYVKGIPLKTHGHISVETFYRYFILEVMKEYPKVLYMDSDIVVMNDVAELYRENIEEYMLAAVKDVDFIGNVKSDKKCKEYMSNILGMDNELEYFQAGVLLFNLQKMRMNTSCEELVEKSLERDWKWQDQDVLNMICEGKVKFLNQKWNTIMNWICGTKSRMDIIKNVPEHLLLEYQEARKSPCIIHYAGKWKPWIVSDCDYAEAFWKNARGTSFYKKIQKGCLDPTRVKNKTFFYLGRQKRVIFVNMRWMEKIFPSGSDRRAFLKKIFRKFYS